MSTLQSQQPQQPRDDVSACRPGQDIGSAGNSHLTKGESVPGDGHNTMIHPITGPYFEDLLDPLCHRICQALDGMKTALTAPAVPMTGMYSYEDIMHLYRSTRDNLLNALDDFLVNVSLRYRMSSDHSNNDEIGRSTGIFSSSSVCSREVPQLPLEHYLDLKLEAAVGEQVRVGANVYPETPIGSQMRTQGQENTLEQATDAPLRFGCESCNKRFSTSADLVRHCQEAHSRERPYICTLCAKSFKKRCHLDRHSILHSGERQYSCEICRSSFYRSDILDRHRRTHIGVKPYRCDICSHGCRDAYSLALHRRTHTKERMSPCTNCGKMFRNSCLMRHTNSCRQNTPTLPED